MSNMTAQNAIHCMKVMICEEVCEECDYYGKTGTDHCEADAVRMAIKALEEQQRWTPCSEKPPEKNGYYLVTGRQGAVNKRKYEDGRWYGNWAVLAWMPLPKPYGGKIDG